MVAEVHTVGSRCTTGWRSAQHAAPLAPAEQPTERVSVSGPRGSFGDGRAMRTAVASKFRQSAGDGTLRIGEMRGSHPCAWHSAAATCGAAVALSALASLLGDWGRSPQQAGACLTLWSEVPEENWPFLLKILAMSVMGAGDALAMSPRRLPSFSQPWLAMAFGQSPARAVFWPDFASIWRFRQLSETLERVHPLRCSLTCCPATSAVSSIWLRLWELPQELFWGTARPVVPPPSF